MRLLLPILMLVSCAVVDDDDVPAGPTHVTLTGSATWAVDFDADAEAAGAVDCAYTRHYAGARDGSVPWACPECDVLVRAEVQSLDGLECYRAVSGAGASPAPTELLSRVGSTFRRSGGGPLQALGTVDVDGDAWG